MRIQLSSYIYSSNLSFWLLRRCHLTPLGRNGYLGSLSCPQLKPNTILKGRLTQTDNLILATIMSQESYSNEFSIVPKDLSRQVQVIGAGMGRTGTVSFSLALQKLLDGPVCHGGNACLHREVGKNSPLLRSLLYFSSFNP